MLNLRYFIVDDDSASRTMLKNIIREGELGVVVGEADNGVNGLSSILTLHPEVVLIDLLMPELDGIETIELLKDKGFKGQFIMISQIVNKEMVGKAYEIGVDFFIHKPINRIEVQSILRKMSEQIQLRNSLVTIQESLANIGLGETKKRQQSVKEIVLSILNDMGIIGEIGSEDIISIIEFLINRNERTAQLPSLKELYEAVIKEMGCDDTKLKREGKAMEQRIRRTILTAINNLATLGVIDYTNAEFEYYAPRYFDFQEVRNQMLSIREEKNEPTKVKINIRKFLQVLYLETIEKFNQS